MPGAISHCLARVFPELPALPEPGRPVLVRVPAPRTRREARPFVRSALREILSTWSGLPVSALPLEETSRGPVWRGQLGGYPLDISISYSGPDAWIAMLRSGSIGVDALELQPLPDAEAVARLYLGPAVVEAIRHAPDPCRAFALAWTEMEARLKCAKRNLREWSPAEARPDSRCRCLHRFPAHGLVVAVALLRPCFDA